MIDPRLTWFAMGVTFGFVLCGWPWRSRFSRYSRMQDPDWRRSFNHENTNPPSGPPPLKFLREPVRLDEGRVQRGNGNGGPTTAKPRMRLNGPSSPAARPAAPPAPQAEEAQP